MIDKAFGGPVLQSPAMVPVRSLLFVPGNRRDLLDKLERFEADAYILDLEDGVPAAEKAAARKIIAEEAPAHRKAGRVLHVRVNPPHSPWHRDDLTAALESGVACIHLPKISSAEELRDCDRRLLELAVRWGFRPDEIELYPTVETSLALLHAGAIAAASARIAGLALGADDLTAEWGAVRSAEGREIDFARATVVVAATAFGVTAIDATYPFHKDLEGCARDAREARARGFKGKQAIHPAQCPIINQAFTPSPLEVERARAIVAAAEAARSGGRGTASAGGTQIDAAVERSARRLIEWSERIDSIPPG